MLAFNAKMRILLNFPIVLSHVFIRCKNLRKIGLLLKKGLQPKTVANLLIGKLRRRLICTGTVLMRYKVITVQKHLH